MTAAQLSLALLLLGVLSLGAAAYLDSPWPGVVLCGMSAGLCAAAGRGVSPEETQVETLRAQVEAQTGEIRSIRANIAARTIGG